MNILRNDNSPVISCSDFANGAVQTRMMEVIR